MAKNQNTFEKRSREMSKKRKAEEKRKRRQFRRVSIKVNDVQNNQLTENSELPDDTAAAPALPD